MITSCTISIPVIPNTERNPVHLGISHYIRDDEEYTIIPSHLRSRIFWNNLNTQKMLLF